MSEVHFQTSTKFDYGHFNIDKHQNERLRKSNTNNRVFYCNIIFHGTTYINGDGSHHYLSVK